MTSPLPPAGWYPDPVDSGRQRYWDGTQWTDQNSPAAAPPPAAALPQKAKSNSTLLIIGGAVLVAVVGGAIVGGGDNNDSDPSVPAPAVQSGEDNAATVLPSKILAAQTDSEFASSVTVKDVRCGSKEVRGSVVNNSSERLDIYITVVELDGAGAAIDDRLTAVKGLAPGETGRWSSRVLVDSYSSCEIVISSIFTS
jgi:hypothetical protein